MSTLAEIEAAADALPEPQKEELFHFLAARLRSGSLPLPPSRDFKHEQIQEWIADDVEDMRRFREGR